MARTNETRRRYRDPRTYQDERQKVKLGLSKVEPKYTEVEVVTLKGPDGPVHVTKDQVAAFETVWAEMAEAKK